MVLEEAIIYTDGSGGADGSGGWAAIVASAVYAVEITGWAENTTSNRMEMTAAIEGLNELKEPHEVSLISDSAYLINAIKNDWFHRWFEEEEKGYKRPNIDLWHELYNQLLFHKVKPIKIKGHNGHEYNVRADKLAVNARKNLEEGYTILYGFPTP